MRILLLLTVWLSQMKLIRMQRTFNQYQYLSNSGYLVDDSQSGMSQQDTGENESNVQLPTANDLSSQTGNHQLNSQVISRREVWPWPGTKTRLSLSSGPSDLRRQRDEAFHHALESGLQVMGPDPGQDQEEVQAPNLASEENQHHTLQKFIRAVPLAEDPSAFVSRSGNNVGLYSLNPSFPSHIVSSQLSDTMDGYSGSQRAALAQQIYQNQPMVRSLQTDNQFGRFLEQSPNGQNPYSRSLNGYSGMDSQNGASVVAPYEAFLTNQNLLQRDLPFQRTYRVAGSSQYPSYQIPASQRGVNYLGRSEKVQQSSVLPENQFQSLRLGLQSNNLQPQLQGNPSYGSWSEQSMRNSGDNSMNQLANANYPTDIIQKMKRFKSAVEVFASLLRDEQLKQRRRRRRSIIRHLKTQFRRRRPRTFIRKWN